MAMSKGKSRTAFVCRVCGVVEARWMGKCPACGTWDALEKFNQASSPSASDEATPDWTPWSGADGDPPVGPTGAAQAVALARVTIDDVRRLATGVDELDRVLGGGLVPGSVVLLGGDPGIGKSTLLLQAMAGLAAGGPGRSGMRAQPDQGEAASRILYVSSEESARQVRLRAERLLVPASSTSAPREVGGEVGDGGFGRVAEHLFVLSETDLARIVEQARLVRPAVLVVDSLQMVFRSGVDASPGSVTQLRRCCIELVGLAKRTGTAVLIVGHVTKDGQLAGPRLVEHLVDVVLSFEGDRHHAHRLVRATKNRFGDTLEIGLFEMTGAGLREVAQPGCVVDPAGHAGPGSALCPTMHGTRCVLAEVQALTATGVLGAARRKASGVDANRLAMLIAVLEKHAGLRLADQDIFVAAAGGLRIVEPAADLAIALAIAGVHLGRTLPAGSVVMGEVALSGQIRPVGQLQQRAHEAQRRGATLIGCPRTGCEQIAGAVSTIALDRIGDAIDLLVPKRRP